MRASVARKSSKAAVVNGARVITSPSGRRVEARVATLRRSARTPLRRDGGAAHRLGCCLAAPEAALERVQQCIARLPRVDELVDAEHRRGAIRRAELRRTELGGFIGVRA